ncbi:hypothetical protein P4418_29715, partial [Bacillus thuringiensis]|nr:hypothetical protein [Bacillus thuringiensis]
MDSLMIQGNIYDLQFIKTLMKDGTDDERALDIFKQFQRDIYTTYKLIRHICNPRACEKTTLETVKKSLRE